MASLVIWIDAWSEKYPDDDSVLKRLEGREEFGPDDVATSVRGRPVAADGRARPIDRSYKRSVPLCRYTRPITVSRSVAVSRV